MRYFTIGLLTTGLILLGVGAAPVRAQQCDDGNACTTDDMCSGGTCGGTPKTGSCNDPQDCTVNGQCMPDGSCQGDPAPVGTSCQAGCGTCQQLAPGILLCSGNAADNGKACNPGFGPCFDGACNITTIGAFSTAFCFPAAKVCPDTDQNPCTDNCNFTTGKCEKNAPKCDGTCATCNATTGQCETVTAHVGAACDDRNVCTSQSSCQVISEVPFALCMAGQSTGPSPTPTVTPTATATPPPTKTRTVGTPVTPGPCVGDCMGLGVVKIADLVTGVNIVLDTLPESACPAFANALGKVDVAQLIQGVNNLLNGCPS